MVISLTLYRSGLLLALGLIGYLCLIPLLGPEIVSNQDKLEHLGAFMLLGWLCWQSLPGRPWQLSWLLMSLYGALIELLQGMTVYRQADPWDLLADSCGALAVSWWLSRRNGQRQ